MQRWDPDGLSRSICAFANDLDNLGGGYIIIDIDEAVEQSDFPPVTEFQTKFGEAQEMVIDLAGKINPAYIPFVHFYNFKEKQMLVIWCPGGDKRPYSVPDARGNITAPQAAYVRQEGKSIIAGESVLRQFHGLALTVPFDDRVNCRAAVDQLDLGLIRVYLQGIHSDLFTESLVISLNDLSRAMHIAKQATTVLRPVNAGLLFFYPDPEPFSPGARIDIVWHRADIGKPDLEQRCQGPLDKQLQDALAFVRTTIISERVIKRPDRAEADRFYMFPYRAVQEVLANAVQHKSYEVGLPVVVQIWADRIVVRSYGGLVDGVSLDRCDGRKSLSKRKNRNRRIGDFLSNLGLTEGRGTGISRVYWEMERNGSPAPIFETDDGSYLDVVLRVHPDAFCDVE